MQEPIAMKMVTDSITTAAPTIDPIAAVLHDILSP